MSAAYTQKPTRAPRPRPISDQDIEQAAIVAYGADRAKVFSMSFRRNPIDRQAAEADQWFVLSVDGAIVGRRPDRASLLQLAQRGPIAIR